MTKIKKFIIIFSIFSIIMLPSFSLAATPIPTITNESGSGISGGLVPCGVAEGPQSSTDSSGNVTSSIQVTKPCGWSDLLNLVNNIITFMLYYMAIPIAAIMFAYAGFLLVTAGGEAAGARTKAKNIFTNTVFGLILAVACWIIVKLILTTLGWTGIGSGLGF